MGMRASDLIIGVLMACLGLIGLFAAAGAFDIEMSIFGWALVAFAAAFIMGLVKRHFDETDAARHAAAGGAGHE